MGTSSPNPSNASTGLTLLDEQHDHASKALASRKWQADTYPQLTRQLARLPPLDPDEARHSHLELGLLALAMGQLADDLDDLSVVEPAEAPARLGYALLGQPRLPDGGRDAQAFPALAQLLANGTPHDQILQRFPDIWMVDLKFWKALKDKAAHGELAHLWLTSPGRRLLLDLTALTPDHTGDGGADLGPKRLLAAAGIPAHLAVDDKQERERWLRLGPDAWQTLHAAVPGAFQAHWTPTPTDSVPNAIRHLFGEPLQQMTAVGWLMSRAARQRGYQVGGIASDLAAELPSQLAAALSAKRDKGDGRLDELVMYHASRMLKPVGTRDDIEISARHVWGVGRWLRALLLRNPFAGGDEQVLVARLSALRLTEEPTPTTEEPQDALARSRVGNRMADYAFVSAVATHYRQPRNMSLTPAPVTDRLKKMAHTPAGPDEATADVLDSLGWLELTGHLEPNWAARRLCSDLNIGWLATAPNDVMNEVLQALAQRPQAGSWIAEALFRERGALQPEVLRKVRERWAKLNEAPNLVAALLAATVVKELSDGEQEQAVAQATSCDALWRPWLLGSLADQVPRLGDLVLDPLLEAVGTGPERGRLDAMLVSLRLIAKAEDNVRERWQPALWRPLVDEPFFSANIHLRREVRRLGLSAPQ